MIHSRYPLVVVGLCFGLGPVAVANAQTAADPERGKQGASPAKNAGSPNPTTAETDGVPTGDADRLGSDRGWVGGPYSFDLHLRGGVSARLDEPPLYEADRVGGLLVGGGLGMTLSRRLAVGLAYEHIGLGNERSQSLRTSDVTIDRGLHTVWIDARVYPVRFDNVGIYLAVAFGLPFQTVDLKASVWKPETPGQRSLVSCSGSGGPGFAFQGALGIDALIEPGVRLFTEGGFANHRLTGDVVDNCSPGAGTANVALLRLGVGYGWGL